MPRADLIGQVLDDRYRVIEPLGEGAMGSVFRGERLKLGRQVAIKVLNDSIPNEASRRRFEREAMAMAKLEHPNCGSVLDVGVHDGKPYVVMELVSGQNLKEVLTAGALAIPRAVDITRQVLAGLAHAHEHGMIHRDIKPANIMLSQKTGVGDHVKILDFGLARFNQDTSNLTGGMVLGTPNYMAPEQIRGEPLDLRVDLYSCGVMLFELLTGAKPFHAADPHGVCMQHISAPPPRLVDKAKGRSFGGLEAVVARALEKDRERRFPDAAAFSKALVEAGEQLKVATPPAPAAPKPPPAAAAKQPPKPPAPAAAKQPPKPPAPAATKQPAAETLELVEPMEPPAATAQHDPAPILAQTGAVTAGAEPARGSSWRVFALVGGAVAAAAIVIGVVVATRSDAKPQAADVAPAAAPPRPVVHPTVVVEPPPAAEPSKPDAVADLVARATEHARAGRREAALDLLLDARKSYPKDARLPYHASKLYLDKMWWDDGLKQARAALALDPEYKTDADLIKLVLKGFNTTKSYDWTLARFLRDDIGAAAKPFIEDTARSHPNPIVRKRAAAELARYP